MTSRQPYHKPTIHGMRILDIQKHDSLRVSRSPRQPAVSTERDDRSGRVFGGVLQQLRGQVRARPCRRSARIRADGCAG